GLPIAASPFSPAGTTGRFAPGGGILVRPLRRARLPAAPCRDSKARNRRGRSDAQCFGRRGASRRSNNLSPENAYNRAGNAPAPLPRSRERNSPRAVIRFLNWPRRRPVIAPRPYLALAPRQVWRAIAPVLRSR